MILFLRILVGLFTVVGTAVLVRAAWLLFRGAFRRGVIHFALALLAFVVAVGFYLAQRLFITAA
ncbi:MAG TPA: hypothetical protein VNI57_06205 [Candidatus Saccharimonadales bacterium]|nr:hypothetical protein [Candidatus Saccharimonadales bacterium]